MNRHLSPFLAGVLLASFLAGGWAAPTLHRVQHAQEQYAAQQAAPRCAHGAPALEQDSAQVELGQCWLCVRHVLSVTPPPVWCTSASPPEATLRVSAPAFHPFSCEGRFVIRGPPHA